MGNPSNIKYLSHQQIDKIKWDACINTAENGLVYTYSYYLDAMSKHWDALVMSKGLHSENDYEAVMPLTWNKKYGICYLYQPFLAAQLGIFGKGVTEQMVHSFIEAIPSSFRFIDISLNNKNPGGSISSFIIQRNNYILDLNKPYETIRKDYSENIHRNIRKAFQLGCTVQKGIDVEMVIELATQQMKNQGTELVENIHHFRTLFHNLHSRQMAVTYGIFSTEKEILASCVFFLSHNRAYYILTGNHPKGKTTGSSHALIDAFIKDHAGKNIVLDFEGSDISSLALFYSSFGATLEIYPSLKINRLPFYLKWLKK